MTRRFAVSDIHGCSQTFRALLEQLHFTKNDELYLLGDYIDRGPDSKGVIDHIWELEALGYKIHCLKGNHEQMMLDAYTSSDQQGVWLRNGGWATIGSFGAVAIKEIPEEYLYWMKNLDYYHKVDQYILVHAGLDFRMSDPLEEKYAMLWSRKWYQNIDYNWLGDRIILHGHTPIGMLEMSNMLHQIDERFVLNIDNGCAFPKDGLGNLCAFNLDDQTFYFHPCID